MGRQGIYDRTGSTYEVERYGAVHMTDYLGRRNAALTQLIAQHTSGRPAVRILDVGCGTGLSLSHVAKDRPHDIVYGCDFSRTMLRQTRDKMIEMGRRPTVALGSALQLPVADASFDVVYATRFIHQFANKRQVFDEFRRVTKPSGLIIVEFYARLYHWMRYYVQGVRESRDTFFTHFPTTDEVRATVGGTFECVPLRLGGAKALHSALGPRGVERLTAAANRFPLRLALDEYFVVVRQ